MDEVHDDVVDGQHWRCRCGRTSLHITQTFPNVTVEMQCRFCLESAAWLPSVPPAA